MKGQQHLAASPDSFESLTFSPSPHQSDLRIHGKLSAKDSARLSSAVRLAHSLEKTARGANYLNQGCACIGDRLAKLLSADPYHLQTFTLTTDNTLITPSSTKFPRGWERATDYMNHTVTGVALKSCAVAIDCTAPHYLKDQKQQPALADVIVAPNEQALIEKLSCYYGGTIWIKAEPGKVPLPDLL